MRILIASADLIQAKMTRFLLEDVGYSVKHCEDEFGLRQTLKKEKIDLVLLDEQCPDSGGIELCREIRVQYHTPIIYLAENCSVTQRVQALTIGADDALSLPYHPNEMLARLMAVMRRYGEDPSRLHPTYQPLAVGPVNLDPVLRRVVINGSREEPLTEREFQLLYYLVQNARRILSSRQLLQHIWGVEDVSTSNLVPVYIGRLRRKIEPDPVRPNHIVRVRDLGYSFHP